MANGNAALHALVEPPSAPALAPTELGKAVAAAVIAIAMGIDDYATSGVMTPTSRVWAGGMLGRLAELHLAHLGERPDFAEVAFTEGRRAVREHPAGIFLTRLGRPGQVDMVIDELIGHALAISAKVVADELALRAH